MSEFERESYIEWLAGEARRPVQMPQGARARVMDAVRSAPQPGARPLLWLTAPRAFAVSPLTTGLLAAGLVGLGVLAGRVVSGRDGRPMTGQPAVVATHPQFPVHDTVPSVKFELNAPKAGRELHGG